MGALYGYAAGSDGGIKEYWKDNQWFRITTYLAVTVAVLVISYFCPPAGFAIGCMQPTFIGACAGAAIGAIYGGTDGFEGGWSWEMAAKGMMIGSIMGAVIGYAMGVDSISASPAGKAVSGTATYGPEGNIVAFTYGTGGNGLSISSFSLSSFNYQGMSPVLKLSFTAVVLGIKYKWN